VSLILAQRVTALTNEFEQALRRCRPDKPIRFLLLKPTDENLTYAAQRAGSDKTEYINNVLNSLKKIADIRNRRNYNIQVRFYHDAPEGKPRAVPIFRLVFIDDKLCLMSYNVFGEGGGSELPQLHVVAVKGDRKASESFYYALEQYYESLWAQADPWEFKEFILNA
ncbi:MAG: hypothetical protein Q7I89_01005, partial [Syntrophales bacterium]|nr:hypothetical protein [Syntrophales bacterium]